MPKGSATARLHLPFGTAVRNAFHLWSDNESLRRSCGTQDPEECSGIIFDNLWESIRSGADSQLVRRLDCQFTMVERLRVRYRGLSVLRMGAILDSLNKQIANQLSVIKETLPTGCSGDLSLRIVGNPNLECWARVEFSEDGRDPVSLASFLGWFDWRNAFAAVHVPPFIELRFRELCAWPQRPTLFHPGG